MGMGVISWCPRNFIKFPARFGIIFQSAKASGRPERFRAEELPTAALLQWSPELGSLGFVHGHG